MKSKILVLVMICVSLYSAAGCGKEALNEDKVEQESTALVEIIESAEVDDEPLDIEENEPEQEYEPGIEQTGMCVPVPEEYYETIDNAGTVLEVTYGSKDYANSESYIEKKACVYLPYGYDEADLETKYDVCYLMHGLEGYAGEFFDRWCMKEMLDSMIANGDIKPTIFVSATFYYDGCEQDYDTSVEQLKVFNQDFENDLMPFIEERFHTYAASTSKEDLIASRDHRAFGGFSLGAYTTWMQFCYCSDYIKYYLPISGASWYYGSRDDFQTEKNVDYLEQVIKDNNLDEKGYFIYYAVGTEDEIKIQTLTQAEEMLKRSDVFTPEHFVFYQMEGGVHDRSAERDFMYNGLPWFFN